MAEYCWYSALCRCLHERFLYIFTWNLVTNPSSQSCNDAPTSIGFPGGSVRFVRFIAVLSAEAFLVFSASVTVCVLRRSLCVIVRSPLGCLADHIRIVLHPQLQHLRDGQSVNQFTHAIRSGTSCVQIPDRTSTPYAGSPARPSKVERQAAEYSAFRDEATEGWILSKFTVALVLELHVSVKQVSYLHADKATSLRKAITYGGINEVKSIVSPGSLPGGAHAGQRRCQ